MNSMPDAAPSHDDSNRLLRANGRELPASSREGEIQEGRSPGEMRSSEIRYRRLFEAARDGILILDPETRRITDANPFMTELLDYRHEEFLGKELWQIGLLKDEGANQAAFRELMDNNFVRYEDLPLQSKTGEVHDVEFVSNLYEEDGKRVIQCNIRDITNRKLAEEVVSSVSSKEAARLKRRSLVDMVVIFALSLVVFIIGFVFDVFDPLFRYIADESTGMDKHLAELAGTMAFLSLALLVFAYRRWKEGQKEVLSQTLIAGALRSLHGEMEKRVRDRTEELVRANEDLHAEEVIRKKAVQQVSLLDTCIANLNDIILITEVAPLDEPGPRIVFVNNAFERITGYTPAEAIGRSPRFLQGEKTDRHILREIRQALEQHQPIRRQVVNYRKDGSEYLMDIDMAPVLDDKGICTHFVAIEHDITEQMRAEQTLRESERRFREALENIELVAVTVDKNGLITFCNDYLLKLTGWTREELMGADWFLKFVPETEVTLRQLFFDNLGSGDFPSHYENLITTRNGELRRIRWSNTMLRDETDHIIGVTGIGEDVTEQNKAQEQLLWKTAFLEANVHSSPDGILIVDRDGKKILQNQKMVELWGIPQEFADKFDDGDQLEWVTKQTENPGQFAEKVAYLSSHPEETSQDKIELTNGKILDRYSSPVRGQDGTYYGRIWSFRDITERKRTEDSLKLFRALIEQSNDAVEVIDPETGRFLDLNEKAWQRLGYSREEMLLMTMADIAVTAPSMPEIMKITQLSGSRIVEGRHRRKDGSTFPIEASVQYINLDRSYLVAVVRDTTERKHNEEALVESERKFRTLFDMAPDGILMMHNGVFIDSNAKGLEFFGATRDQLLGQPPSAFSPSNQPDGRDSEDKAHEFIQLAQEGHSQVFEWVNRRPDGVLVHAGVSLNRIELGGKVFVQAIVRDITKQKRDQDQIAEQASLLDQTQDAIIVRDLQGGIIFWNKGAERMYGWTRLEAIGRNIGEFLYADPKRFEEINRQTLNLGEWHGDFQHLTKDGGEVTVEARWTLIRDLGGHPKSVLAIYTDITERKKIEAQFLRSQRMESIGTLAGGIAHDLNNILAPIMMSIDILKTTSDSPQTQKILSTIEVSAKRGADIVRQVLSFARGLEGERIEVQPKHLLKDLEHIIKDTFPKDIRLEFSIPNDTWTILGDPTQVHQIMLNLCVNARDAMPNGGTLSIAVENCVLDEQYVAMNLQAKAGRYVKIRVTDTGMGIPPALVDKIFEPFFTTKDVNKGTGLGLSTVMAIVKSHGGTINVYSEQGKGTCFSIYLPAMELSSEGRKEQSEQANLPRGNGETILVIDDEASILTITSQTLEAFGYQVLKASNGADALGIYVQHKSEISVVLTDMRMPVMDGTATIYALMRINPAIKIIAASGLNVDGTVTKASEAGVKHFLTKPYTAAILLKTMRMILDEA